MKEFEHIAGLCESRTLDKCECMQRLAGVHNGHLGLTAKALPLVTPIRYRLIAGAIVFATGSATELAAARNHNVACVEVSGIDAATGDDWSVVAIGRLHQTTDPRWVWPDEKPLPPAWGAPLADDFVALDIELLTGSSSTGICSH
jgi:hypothetical protein